MSKFVMRWPELGLEVKCESIGVNEAACEVLVANLPIKAVQGHEMVGGWCLHDRSVIFGKKAFGLRASELVQETMDEAPEGRISLLFPQTSGSELLVKYGETVDNRKYVPVAQVVEEDLEVLKKAGRAQWKSATRTKEVITVEFVAGEEK